MTAGSAATPMPEAPQLPDMGGTTANAKEGGTKAAAEAKKAVEQVQKTATSMREKYKKFLGFEYFSNNNDVEDAPFWKAIPLAMKDVYHGTVTNVLRRGSEAGDTLFSTLDASFYTLWRPLSHPVKTMLRFDKYLIGGAGRLLASTGSIANNYLVRPLTKGVDELYKGVISRPLERLNHKVEKIPIVGETLAWTTNGIAKVLGWPMEKLGEGSDYVKDKLDNADTWMKDYGKFDK